MELKAKMIGGLAVLFITSQNSPIWAQDNYPACIFLPTQSGVVKQITKENNVILTNGQRLTLANIKVAHGINKQELNHSLKGKKITYFSSGQKTDRKTGLDKSCNMVSAMLAEKGLAYDEFVMTVGQQRRRGYR